MHAQKSTNSINLVTSNTREKKKFQMKCKIHARNFCIVKIEMVSVWFGVRAFIIVLCGRNCSYDFLFLNHYIVLLLLRRI